MTPVDQGRHTRIDLAKRTDEIAEIIVFRLVAGSEIEMDGTQIIRRHPFGADAAQRRLPSVHMRIDEARHHDLIGRIDDLIRRRAKIATSGFDTVTRKQQFARTEVADIWIERHQPTATDQHALRGQYPSSPTWMLDEPSAQASRAS